MNELEFSIMLLTVLAALAFVGWIRATKKIDYWKTRAGFFETEVDTIQNEVDNLKDLNSEMFGLLRATNYEMNGAEWDSPIQTRVASFIQNHTA